MEQSMPLAINKTCECYNRRSFSRVFGSVDG